MIWKKWVATDYNEFTVHDGYYSDTHVAYIDEAGLISYDSMNNYVVYIMDEEFGSDDIVHATDKITESKYFIEM